MAIAKQARKKTISATSAEGARVMEALAQASKEAKRIADANKLPFIAGRKQSWSVPKYHAGNMKRTWVLGLAGATGAMPSVDEVLPGIDEVLREATQVKNVWVPYGA
jgi:hypothetical protein